MINSFKNLFPILNFLLGLMVYAIINWPISYGDLEMINPSFFFSCVISAFIIGIIGVVFLEQSIIKSAGWTSLGFFSAHILRLIFDWIGDPASHNLFPFELLILAFYCFPPSFIGAGISSLVIKFFHFRKFKSKGSI